MNSPCNGIGIISQSNSEANQYSLSQNYPNPFNPSTRILFTIPEAGNVKLTLYDALGRLMKTLLNEHKSRGMYEFELDASDLSSGVYFYKLEAPNYSNSKKMLLIK